MNVRDFWRKYNAQNLEPVYCLIGDDEGLRDFCIGRLRALTQESAGGKAQESSHSGLRELEDALVAASTASFFTTRQLIVIRGIEDIKKKDTGHLEYYLAHPTDFTVLVLSLGKLKGTTTLSALVNKSGVKVECNKLSEPERRNRVRKLLNDEGLTATHEALDLLVARSGDSILDIDQSVEKIVLRSEPGEQVEVERVRELVDDVREESVFVLITHIMEGRHREGVLLWRRMLNRGESSGGLLYLLYRHLRLLMQFHGLKEQNTPSKEYAQRLGVPPYFVTNYRAQAERLPPGDIACALERLRRIDFLGKQGLLDDGPALEMNLGVLFTKPPEIRL